MWRLPMSPPPVDHSRGGEATSSVHPRTEPIVAEDQLQPLLHSPSPVMTSTPSASSGSPLLPWILCALLAIALVSTWTAQWGTCLSLTPLAHWSTCPESSLSSLSSPTDRPCLNGLYREGEWTRSETEWYPYLTGDHYSLSCDHSDSPVIWQFNSTERAIISELPPSSSLLNSSQMYVRPALKWVWTPSQCSLIRFPLWSPVYFCLALASRPLLIVGDSISYQQYQSLIFLLGDESRDEQFGGADSDICHRLLDAHHKREMHRWCTLEASAWPYSDTPRLCANGSWTEGKLPPALNSSHVRIRFARNDFLSAVSVANWSRAGTRDDVEYPWRNLVTPTTLLVINTGVHVMESGVYRSNLQDVLTWLRSTYPCVTIVWRSSVPGHADCNSPWHQMPLTRSRYLHFDQQGQLLHRGNPVYKWEDVRALNAVARELIANITRDPDPICASSSAFRVGGVYEIDVDSFDKLRPDSHRPSDCLHQCLPGPVDTWNRLLYNVLIGQAS